MKFRAACDQIISTAPRYLGCCLRRLLLHPLKSIDLSFVIISAPCVMQQVMGKQQAVAPESELLPQ